MSVPSINFNLNTEKNNIFNAVTPTAKIYSNSDAGCGKSYLMKAIIAKFAIDSPDMRLLVLCFNTQNYLEFKAFIEVLRKKLNLKLEKFEARTFHNDGNKQGNIQLPFSQTAENNDILSYQKKYGKVLKSKYEYDFTVHALRLLKVKGAHSKQAIEKHLEKVNYNKSDRNEVISMLMNLLSVQGLKDKNYKSPADMLALHNLLNTDKKVAQFDAVLVDEVQDCNLYQLANTLRRCKQDGFIFLVGDGKQEVNQFQGSVGFDLVIQAFEQNFGSFDALELHETMRNSQAIVSHVNNKFGTNTVTSIKGGKVVYDYTESQMFDLATGNEKDLAIIAPRNRTLYKVFAAAVKANVFPMYAYFGKTKNDQLNIIKEVRKIIEKHYDTKKAFMEYIENAKKALGNGFETKLDTKEKNPYKALFLAEMIVNAISEATYKTENKTAILSALDNIVNAEKKVTLTTGHMSKGMTYKNTVVLDYEWLDSDKCDFEKPYCIGYVMETRGKVGLYFIDDYMQDEEKK